jgi:membrane protease YdiL (CAAX protease family)
MSTELDKLQEFSSAELEGKLALWEIASVVTSCLLVEWVVSSFVGRSKIVAAVPILLAVGFMFYSHRQRGETIQEIGFRFENLLHACLLLLIPTALFVFTITVVWITRYATFQTPWRDRFLLLPFWALFQQYALNGFINRRAQLVFGKGAKSVLLVAIVFSLLHLPNLQLTILTFIGGFVWAAIYQRQPNLLALALSHSICSITLALTVAPKLLDSLRVGFKYFG